MIEKKTPTYSNSCRSFNWPMEWHSFYLFICSILVYEAYYICIHSCSRSVLMVFELNNDHSRIRTIPADMSVSDNKLYDSINVLYIRISNLYLDIDLQHVFIVSTPSSSSSSTALLLLLFLVGFNENTRNNSVEASMRRQSMKHVQFIIIIMACDI